MDSEERGGGCGIAVYKLDASSFQVSKNKINLTLTYQEIDAVIQQPNAFREIIPEYVK